VLPDATQPRRETFDDDRKWPARQWSAPGTRAIFVAMTTRPPDQRISLTVRPGHGRLPTATLAAADGARAEVAPHGAHVVSWRPAPEPGEQEGVERLFVSQRTAWQAGVAIRGGVPVIFPQFADTGPLPKHGFARTREWQVLGLHPAGGGRARVSFRLDDSDDTRALWPHRFSAELTVTVGGRTLEVALAVSNPGDVPFACTAALHSYLRVGDLAAVELRGLAGVRYRDSAAGGRERVGHEAALTIEGEVDRIYLDAPMHVEVVESGRRLLDVDATGFPDVVVWNPGPEKGAALTDLEPGGFARMLCVEAAAVGTPIVVEPGGRWLGTQTLTAVAPPPAR
jgi:glucose-6-phosphate 1-epimerase